MRGSDLKDKVRWLLARVTRAPEQPFPGGAGEADLVDLARRVGAELPDDLAAWLRVCKGEAIGPGGVFGARPDQEAVDVATWSAIHPGWLAEGWLPVAGDGCGNCYVLLTTGPLTGFVGFIDTVTDPDRIGYVVASNLWRFLFFLFRSELGERSWPFDAQQVLAEDPPLAEAPATLLPWSSA